MGCCHPEKSIEGNEIYFFFQKMEKEYHFTFTIDNYEENYEQIITLSTNKFKKLKKKQQLRLGFVNEILNNINKIYIEEKEDRVTKTILFNLLILTLTLDNYLKEIKLNSDNNNSANDMEQFLLTIVIKTLKKQFFNHNNLKVVLYYTAKLLDLLFPEINDISQYYNIEEYIHLINGITDEIEILQTREIYPFIKVNLSCLGECFKSNYPKIFLKEDSIDILINYYINAYLFNRNFLIENYKSLNKILFLFNNDNINNINNTKNNKKDYNINNELNHLSSIKEEEKYEKSNERTSNVILKSYTTDFNNKTTTAVSTKKNINNYNLSNHSISQSKIKSNNNIFKNSMVSNMDEFSFSQNNPSIFDVFKSQEFKDIKILTKSFYFFLNVTIQDILAGKKLFKKFDDMIDIAVNNLLVNNINNEISFKIDISNNKNIFRIIYLILFNKCKLENNTIIILSFLYFISDKIKQEKIKVQYYDILSQIYYLFNNDNIKHLIVSLFSQSFIKDIENKNNADIVGEIFGTNQSLFHSNKIRIFKHFLINIGINFKELQSISLKIKILKRLTDTLTKYINNFNKNDNDETFPLVFLSTEQRINKFNLKGDEFLSLFQNFELDEDIFHENNYNYRSYFIKYLKFHVNLSIFLADNFTFLDIFKTFAIRKKAFERITYFITELEIFSVIANENCVTDIIILLEILIKIINKNSINCLEDFHIISCYMGNSLKKIINDVCLFFNSNLSSYVLKLSYSVIIFLLIQLKKIFFFPNSIIKIHKTIIDSINKYDKKIADYLNAFKYEFYNDNKLTIDIYQDLQKYLKEKKTFVIKYELFNQVTDIIYEKLFGNTSSLYLFFESQNLNLTIDDDLNKSGEGKYTNMSQDHIEYINQIEMKFTEDKEEVSLRKKMENEDINLPNLGENDSNATDRESQESEKEYSEHLKI